MGAAGERKLDELFGQMDTDFDGMLSRAEFIGITRLEPWRTAPCIAACDSAASACLDMVTRSPILGARAPIAADACSTGQSACIIACGGARSATHETSDSTEVRMDDVRGKWDAGLAEHTEDIQHSAVESGAPALGMQAEHDEGMHVFIQPRTSHMHACACTAFMA